VDHADHADEEAPQPKFAKTLKRLLWGAGST
jgi:hypothetical protein